MEIRRDILQRTSEWLEVKRGQVSGTGMKPILSSRSKGPWKTYIYDLIAQDEYDGKLIYEEGYLSKAVQWGVDMEPFAKQAFENQYGMYIEEVGWIGSTDRRYKGKLGCSPDGFIDIRNQVEIKCLDSKRHIEAIVTNKIPHEFMAQVINYFVVNGRLLNLWFIFYDPRIKREENRLFVIKVERKEMRQEIKDAKEKLDEFFKMKKEIEVKYYNK